jgi:hypothetical protein
MWPIYASVEALGCKLPNRSVIIADGEVDYFVKTIADTVKSNLASFQRLGDSSGKTVAEIRIGRGEELFAEKDTSLPREDL